MEDSKYNVLLMRDDSAVKRYRVSPLWVKSFVYILTALLVFSVGGIVFGVWAWSDSDRMKKELFALRKQLQDTQVQLERLQNMQKIFDAGNKKDTPKTADKPADKKEADAAKAGGKFPNIKEQFPKVDLGQIRLENFQALVAEKKVKVTFDLTNLEQNKSQRGKIALTIISKDAQQADVKLRNEESSYVIQNFRPFQADISFPEGLEPDAAYGMRVTLTNNNGKLVYSEAFEIKKTKS